MKKEHITLQFNQANSRMNIARNIWEPPLGTATVDSAVDITHATLDGNKESRNHVAIINKSVGCHSHSVGDETYQIVSGDGTLYWGEVQEGSDGVCTIIEEVPVDVKMGDSFIIPEGYAHQLVNTGEKPLIITFNCPDSHLKDDEDRKLLRAIHP